MIPQSKAKIFQAKERGVTETEWLRSYHTFNFGNYQNEHKTPFETLYALNDTVLAGNKKYKLLVEEDSDVILLPVVGSIMYEDNTGHFALVEAGQAQLLTVQKNTMIEFHNPYDHELVNFLQICIKHDHTKVAGQATFFSFNTKRDKNKLIELFSPDGNGQNYEAENKFFIGKFTGREEALHMLARPCNSLFAFVIEGAFEMQYRLLEARDGLALWNVKEVELETLSNDAIILLIELQCDPGKR